VVFSQLYRLNGADELVTHSDNAQPVLNA